MKQLFKTKNGVTPIEQIVFFRGDSIMQIDQFGKYVDVYKTEDQFTISKADFEKAKSIFTDPEISLVGNQVIFKEGKNKVKFSVVDFEDTTLKIDIDGDFVELPEHFYETINKAANFAAVNDKRLILNGININKDYVVATNSYKLYKTKLNDMDIEEININRDVVSLLENMKAIRQVDGHTTFTNKNKDKFLLLKEVDGDYPKIQSIIDFTKEHKLIKFNKSEIEKALSVADKLDIEKVKLTNNKITSYRSNIEFEQDIDLDINIEIILNVKTLKGSLISGELGYKGDKEALITINGDELSLVLPLRA